MISDSIIPVPSRKCDEKGAQYINPLVPRASCMLIAPSFSGKTVLMLNWILRPRFGVKYGYKWIYILSPTAYVDTTWDILDGYNPKLGIPVHGNQCKKRVRSATIERYDSGFFGKIETVIGFQEMADPKKRGRVLLILDDIADSMPSRSKILDKVFMRGRHYDVYCWISTQSYRRIPRGLRLNAAYFVFFSVNANERKVIVDELATDVKTFVSMFISATSVKYGFLTMDRRSGIFTKSMTPIK